MRKKVIKVLKGPVVARAMRERQELYRSNMTREDILSYQTSRFNAVWSKTLSTSPFYREWAKYHSLPRQIKDIRETSDFPVLTKRHLAEHSQPLLNFPPTSFYVSGGSTGEPTKFPRHSSEATMRYVNTMIAHSWLNLDPGARYIHLWGHAHLFGQGKLAFFRKQLRKSKDWLVGGFRLNAYNQSSADVRRWMEVIQRFNPEYMIGYASALVNLAIEVEETRGILNIPNLKWIICTAESISMSDKERLSRAFGVPVVVEYGANETGIIAHSRPLYTERLQLLWGSLYGSVDQNDNLRLSTLDPRIFPLINYAIGDRIEKADCAEHVLSFRSVSGRTNEQISLRLMDGAIGKISMVGVVGALKNVPGIRTVQAAQLSNDSAEIYLTGPYEAEDADLRSLFLHELGITGVHVHPDALSFRRLSEPIKSVAGKTTLIVARVPDDW